MGQHPDHPATRDRGLRRVRHLTLAATGLGAGAVVLLSGVAATTIPGTSTGTAASATASATPTAEASSSASLQPAASAPQATTSTTAHAVTGGSR
jgi:hypothetical protein